MDEPMIILHGEDIAAQLGPPGERPGADGGSLVAAAIVRKAAVCLANQRVWWGTFNLTKDEVALIHLASDTGEEVSVFSEPEVETLPTPYDPTSWIGKVVYLVTPSGETFLRQDLYERSLEGRVVLRQQGDRADT